MFCQCNIPVCPLYIFYVNNVFSTFVPKNSTDVHNTSLPYMCHVCNKPVYSTCIHKNENKFCVLCCLKPKRQLFLIFFNLIYK